MPVNVAAQLFSGGLLLGAVYMATDYVTSPTGTFGKVIYGVGCGVLTALMRLFAAMPEGVSFAILLMNIATPLIERIPSPEKWGRKGGRVK